MSDYDDEKQDEYISNSPRKMTDEEHEKVKKDLEDLLIPKSSKIEKAYYFVGGLIVGSTAGLIFDIEKISYKEILRDSISTSVIFSPLFNKVIYNKKFIDSFENSPYLGAGLILGQSFVKYLKN
jgi:hypothetical protein